jgi:hypothetical protein
MATRICSGATDEDGRVSTETAGGVGGMAEKIKGKIKEVGVN